MSCQAHLLHDGQVRSRHNFGLARQLHRAMLTVPGMQQCLRRVALCADAKPTAPCTSQRLYHTLLGITDECHLSVFNLQAHLTVLSIKCNVPHRKPMGSTTIAESAMQAFE